MTTLNDLLGTSRLVPAYFWDSLRPRIKPGTFIEHHRRGLVIDLLAQPYQNKLAFELQSLPPLILHEAQASRNHSETLL